MKILVILLSLMFAQFAQAEDILAVQSRYSAEGLLGIHNSAGGGGIGFGYQVGDRLSIGIRWFTGGMDETKTYENYDSTGDKPCCNYCRE